MRPRWPRVESPPRFPLFRHPMKLNKTTNKSCTLVPAVGGRGQGASFALLRESVPPRPLGIFPTSPPSARYCKHLGRRGLRVQRCVDFPGVRKREAKRKSYFLLTKPRRGGPRTLFPRPAEGERGRGHAPKLAKGPALAQPGTSSVRPLTPCRTPARCLLLSLRSAIARMFCRRVLARPCAPFLPGEPTPWPPRAARRGSLPVSPVSRGRLGRAALGRRPKYF